MSKVGWNAAVGKSWLALPTEPEVLVAQYGALKRQMPLLYTLIFVNTSAVTYTHWSLAPKWLTIGFSGVLGVVCAWRIFYWMGATYLEPDEHRTARHQLRRTIYLSAVLGSGFLIWSLLLDQFGGTAEHGHIALFVAVTVIGCIFCFVALPQAATIGTIVVTVPYLVYYVSRGNAVYSYGVQHSAGHSGDDPRAVQQLYEFQDVNNCNRCGRREAEGDGTAQHGERATRPYRRADRTAQ